MATKLRVRILFGGRSGEHEVSLLSAASVPNPIDRSRLDLAADHRLPTTAPPAGFHSPTTFPSGSANHPNSPPESAPAAQSSSRPAQPHRGPGGGIGLLRIRKEDSVTSRVRFAFEP